MKKKLKLPPEHAQQIQGLVDERLSRMGVTTDTATFSNKLEANLLALCEYLLAVGQIKEDILKQTFMIPGRNEKISTAKERRSTLLRCRFAGLLNDAQTTQLLEDIDKALPQDRKKTLNVLLRSEGEATLESSAELTRKLKVTCEYLVKIAGKTDEELSREESVIWQTDNQHVNETKEESKFVPVKVEKTEKEKPKEAVPTSFEWETKPNKSTSEDTQIDSSKIEGSVIFKPDEMSNQGASTSSTNGLQPDGSKPPAAQPFEMMSAQFTPVMPGFIADRETNESPAPESELREYSTSPVHDKPMTSEDVVRRFMDLGDEESAEANNKFARSLNQGLKAPPLIEDDPLEWGSGLYENEKELPLPLHVVLNPHKDETEAIAKGRYKILMGKRNEQKIKDKEAEIIIDGLKEDFTLVDKRSLNQIFQQGLQQLRGQSGNYVDVSAILTVGLKLTCFYLIKRAEKLSAENTDSYPYWYMLSKAAGDTGLTGISRNGQYKEFNTDFAGAEHLLNKCVSHLASQNKVNTTRKIDKDMLRGGIHRVTLNLGTTVFVKSCKESITKAKVEVAYEALMETEYGFQQMPGVLVPHAVTDKDTDEVGLKWACMNTTVANRFGPKDWLCRRCGNVNWYHKTKCGKCEVIRTVMQQPVKHVIVRSTDPFKSANVLLQLLADQNKFQKRYKVVAGEYTHTAVMLLGRQKYQGTGYSPEAARRQVDYCALQQTSYIFVSQPPGVISKPAPAISGEEIPTITSGVEEEEILFQTLPNLILTHPHPKETERIARGRYHMLMSHRETGKLSDRETLQLLENLKRYMEPSDKDHLNHLCRDAILKAKESLGSQMVPGTEITMALKITCDYFIKQAGGNEVMETGYPYAHMFSSFKGDSQFVNVSRNGQYCQLDEGFRNNEDKMRQMILDLGMQNNVKASFDCIETQDSVYVAYVTIGQHTYMAESTLSKEDASRAVAMEVLMKAEYAFNNLTTELQQFFRPKKPVMSIIVRSSNPLRTARLLTCLMAKQNKLKKRYTMLDKGYTYRARLVFGNESYKGYGCTPFLARCMADFYCLQRTCFAFTADPPGFASDIAGTDHKVIKEEREVLLKRRLSNREGEDKDMVNEMTELITEDLKQSAHLESHEYELISQKLEKLGGLVPETEEWKKYWPWLKVYKHLQYTCDIISKNVAGESVDQEKWIQEAVEDPDLLKGPQTVTGDDDEDVAEVHIETTDDPDEDQAGQNVDIELDLNDPTILRLFREPHVHEPEYISKGRYNKYLTDRKEGRLKDPQTNIMLIAFKKALSNFEKNELEQALTEGIREIIVNGDELTAKLQIFCDFFVKRSKGKKYNPKLYPHAAVLKASLEKPPPGTNIIEALPTATGRSRNGQYVTFHVKALDENELRSVLSVLAAQNKIQMKEQNKSDTDIELKLKLGDEVHLKSVTGSGSDAPRALLHKALLNTNYEFTALPRQLKRYAEAVATTKASMDTTGADSDTESQMSVPRSDAAGSDSEGDGKKVDVGIPRIPELEPVDLTNKSVARRYEALRQEAKKLLARRERKDLSDGEVSDIVKSVKNKLNPEDLKKLNDMIDRQIKKHLKLTGQTTTSLSWRLTQRLQVTCAFLAGRLKAAAGETLAKKDRSDRKDRHGSRISYPKDAPFMRKAARLPKCRVKLKRLHVKPGRRYDARKYMKNLPPSKGPEKSVRDKERETEMKRKRIVESSSSSPSTSDDEDEKKKKVSNDASTSRKEDNMEVDSDDEVVPTKKPKLEIESKENLKTSSSSSSLFDQMMKKAREKKGTEAKLKTSSSSSSLFDQMVKKEGEKKGTEEKLKTSESSSSLFDQMLKKENEKKSAEDNESTVKSAESIEPSPDMKSEKVETPKPIEKGSAVKDVTEKLVVKDLATKSDKDKEKSGTSSSRDDKKSKTSKEEEAATGTLPGPNTKLPWVPWIEPMDLSRRSVATRYRALKARVAEILQQRKNDKFSNKDTSTLLKGVRTVLSDADMDVITDLAMKALEKIPSHLEGDKHAVRAWKFTQQLQVLCNYLVGRLEKRLPEDIRSKEKRKADKEDYQRRAAFLDLSEKKSRKDKSDKKKDKSKDRDSSSKSSKHKSSSSKDRDSSSKHKDSKHRDKHKEHSSKHKDGNSKHKDESSKHKKERSSKDKKDKDEYKFPSELPDIPVPWIQALEPTNLTGSPKERYETMKQKVESLRAERKDMSLDDSDAAQLIKGIKDSLDEDDLKVLNPVIIEALQKEPKGAEAEQEPGTWKRTAQLSVLYTYILKRLKQQYLKVEEKRKAAAPSAAPQEDTKVTAEFSPPSSGRNSPDMDQVKENIVNIVMTVESDSEESGSSVSEKAPSISDT